MIEDWLFEYYVQKDVCYSFGNRWYKVTNSDDERYPELPLDSEWKVK